MADNRDTGLNREVTPEEQQRTAVMPAASTVETGRKGGAAVGVYDAPDTPRRPASAAASPLARLVPVLLALALLAFLAYRFLRPAATDNTQGGATSTQQTQPYATSGSGAAGNAGAMSGGAMSGGGGRSGGGAAVSPPGPQGR
jgi:uncharacterized membrane protein YgcG